MKLKKCSILLFLLFLIPINSFAEIKENKIKESEVLISNFWTWYFEYKKWPITNKDQNNFDAYSKMLATLIYEYKFEKLLPDTLITDLFFAVNVVKESTVNPKAINKKNKRTVSLLQVHGTCSQDYSRKEILEDPELGLKLGIDCIIETFPLCNIKKWTIDSWKKPLSLYAAGPKAYDKGKIKILELATFRIYLIKKYLKEKNLNYK